MNTKKPSTKVVYLAKYTSRKNNAGVDPGAETDLETFATWMTQYQQLAVAGVRSAAVAHKIALHLERFRQFFLARYGHEQIAACLRRDVQACQTATVRRPPRRKTRSISSIAARRSRWLAGSAQGAMLLRTAAEAEASTQQDQAGYRQCDRASVMISAARRR
jgi:hypothetical protein